MIDKTSDEWLIAAAIKGQRWVEAIKEKLTSSDHKIVKHYFLWLQKRDRLIDMISSFLQYQLFTISCNEGGWHGTRIILDSLPGVNM